MHDKAGDRILEGLLAGVGQRLRGEGDADDISVLKTSAGPAGRPYGCQEDYLVARRGEFGRLADILIPFLVTRQLICGAGTVAQTPRGAVYCLSRPAGPTGNGLSSAAPRPRPFINTRDEPRAAAAGLRRLRVTVSDPAMSETTTLLKAGATDLVLRMAEAGTVLPGLTLDNALQAIGEVSRDITGRSWTGSSSTSSLSGTGQNMRCPCRRRRLPRPTWPITASTAAAACTTSCSAAARSSGPRVTSTSSRRKPYRRSRAVTGRRADPAPAWPPRP